MTPLADKWKLNLFLRAKVNKDNPNPHYPKAKFKTKSQQREDAKVIIKRSTMKHKFIKDEKEIDKYNRTDYYFKEICKKSTGERAQRHRMKRQATNQVNFTCKSRSFDEKDRFNQEMMQEKLYFKRKIASFYHEITKEQKEVRKQKQQIDIEEDEYQKQEKLDIQTHNVDMGVNMLIKDSILETYDLVRHNKRASTIKMYVCSATNYLKKNKRI